MKSSHEVDIETIASAIMFDTAEVTLAPPTHFNTMRHTCLEMIYLF